MKQLLLLSLCLIFPLSLWASPTLQDLSKSDVDKVAKEFSANFVHTTLTPTGTLGLIFGVEAGLMGGITKTPEIDKISKSIDDSTDANSIPHAGIILGASIPFGLAAEMSMIPKIEADDSSLKNTSFAVKWNFGQFFSWPIDVAFRFHLGKSEFSYKDEVSGISTEVSYESSSTGFHFMVGKKILMFEPYAGLGWVKTDTDITLTNGVSIFDFTTSSSYNSENSGAHFLVGANLNLFIFKLGAEYSNVMGVSRTSGKLSLYF